MGHAHVDIPTKLIQLLVSNRSSFVVVTSFFIFKDILKVEFACPCTSSGPVKAFCFYFAALPSLAFFLLFILIDIRCMKIFGRYDSKATNCPKKARRHHWIVACERVVKGLCLGLLWLVTLLNDGDWFVCISTPNINSSAGQLHIACTDEEKLTEEEILIRRFLENESRIISLGCILIIVLVWTIGTCLSLRYKPYYQSLYEEFLEQETGAQLNKKLQALAEGKAIKLCKQHMKKFTHDRDNRKLWETVSSPTFHLTSENTPNGRSTII